MNMKEHFRRIHNREIVSCKFCGRNFKSKEYLQIHTRDLHSYNPKEHQCDICFKTFRRKYSLSAHKEIHTGAKKFKCDICSKNMSTPAYLEIHIKSVHQGIKDYICTICEQRFRSPSNLREHKTFH